jgi:hypothetical protein
VFAVILHSLVQFVHLMNHFDKIVDNLDVVYFLVLCNWSLLVLLSLYQSIVNARTLWKVKKFAESYGHGDLGEEGAKVEFGGFSLCWLGPLWYFFCKPYLVIELRE